MSHEELMVQSLDQFMTIGIRQIANINSIERYPCTMFEKSLNFNLVFNVNTA